MKDSVSRRGFLRKAATLASSATAGLAFVRRASSQEPGLLKAGLVGCGGRGTGAAKQFMESAPNCRVVALADVFPDRLENVRRSLGLDGVEIPDNRCFTGFDGYLKLLETDIDVVLLATPPHFRPMHFTAAVEAKKHAFIEKPVAVDPVGCRQVMAAGEKAKQLGLCVVAGTQMRHSFSRIETQKRIADGAIGRILSMRCFRCSAGAMRLQERQPGWSDIEYQIRNWLQFSWLSGDHLTEQHIHHLDICNWFAQSHPESALGFGGRVRKPVGNTYDFFCVDYTYPEGVHCTALWRQIPGCAGAREEVVIGEKGYTNCADSIWDHAGNLVWKYEGQAPVMEVQEHTDLVTAIRSGKPRNEAQAVAESTMTAIMGTLAAYTGERITWDDAMKSEVRWGPTEYRLGPYEPEPLPLAGKPWA